MNDNHRLSRPWLAAAKATLVYIAVAGLWIAFSDQLLASLSSSARELTRWQTVKGWLFVLATGGLLYACLYRILQRRQEAFDQLTMLFDSIPAVVYVADMQNHDLLFVNRFATEQFGTAGRTGKCYGYLQQGQTQPCPFCTNHLLLRDGQPGAPVTWEFRNTKDGHWYQCLDKALRWHDNRLVRLEIAFDITERKEMERTREELLSAVSHEMRTPLTAITGFTELLLDEPGLPAPARQHVETVFREAEKLTELIQTFLEIRRLKTDQARIDYELIPVAELLEQAADSSRERTGKHRLAIDCPAQLTVYGNRRELIQLFQQLINNACRFSPAGGAISVSGRTADGNVEVAVADQGIGIPLEERERIFEPFHRLDIGDRRRTRGIGLGLAIAREIVALHGGAIRVESSPEGGSCFLVTLPVPVPGSPPP